MQLLESDIRAALIACTDLGDTTPSSCGPPWLHEVVLANHRCRVDAIAVGPQIRAYEIKSDGDSLRRLPSQIAALSATFQNVTLATTNRHLTRALTLVPSWWEVVLAERRFGRIHIELVRIGYSNPCIDPMSFAQLVFRAEALQLLAQYGLDHGMWRETRTSLWSCMVRNLDVDVIADGVRATLLRRLATIATEQWSS